MKDLRRFNTFVNGDKELIRTIEIKAELIDNSIKNHGAMPDLDEYYEKINLKSAWRKK